MTKLKDGIKEIEFYQKNFRNSNLEKFEISDLYDLFPEKETNLTIEKSWPDKWNFCGEAGVYMFLDENLEIAYIGKTNHFGNRFGSYFSNNDEKKCNLKDTWKTIPRYVINVAVPSDSKFESSSLESFLLSKIVTTDNKSENKR
jgi:hypothetical protein